MLNYKEDKCKNCMWVVQKSEKEEVHSCIWNKKVGEQDCIWFVPKSKNVRSF